ncbi:MAG: sulfotransferase [Geminicoccaceae bacterium]
MRVLRRPIYWLVRKALNSYFVREELWRSNRDRFGRETAPHLPAIALARLPPGYGLARAEAAPPRSQAPVFVTARFRSGSTFLWQLFRAIEGVTAYYEPLNERQWFRQPEHSPPSDPSHRDLDDYGAEYAGMADLQPLFDPNWGYRGLHMDERSHDPRLFRYIDELIRRAESRPVLQFNRVDLRLPWLRAHFPGAAVVHLYRHPREQWMSMQVKSRVPLACTLDEFAQYDSFYTLPWARDLRVTFPFLEIDQDIHPYALHYYLWRLSFAFGQAYAHLSLSYEELTGDFAGTFKKLLSDLAIEGAELERLGQLNRGPVAPRWPDYADDRWFGVIEAECERTLRIYFASAPSPD